MRVDTLAVDALRQAQALANLESWLGTMHQLGGYGGPVAHWWQNRYRYAGPGHDWRYEGILTGYAVLLQKTGRGAYRRVLEQAVEDLANAQTEAGHFLASRFEINPGILGTPHEAAASLGLLHASRALGSDRALEVARRNLRALVAALWDEGRQGFNDGVGARGRVPNKLATFAQALMTYAQLSGDKSYLDYGRAAIDDVLRFQVSEGKFEGAVHQYAPGAQQGDGRFFPYYNARCIPPLVMAAEVLAEARYLEAAKKILSLIEKMMQPDGSWPQIVYASGKQADWPRWLAGTADILLAYRALDKALPARALKRLLDSQSASGAFPTAHGFEQQIAQRLPDPTPHYRDVTPVVGWNDKVFRLLGMCLSADLPESATNIVTVKVQVAGDAALFAEDDKRLLITRGESVLYEWHKSEVWARKVHAEIDIH